LLGVVARRRVLAGGDEQPEASPLLDDVAEVCQQFYRVAGGLLGRLLGGRTWS
jgi:hypothetical protein